jgi:hypothetical protein
MVTCARALILLLPPKHFVAVGGMMGNVRARISESLDELRALDTEIAAWHARWEASYSVSRHRTQLDLLAGLTRGLIDILFDETSEIELTQGADAVYAECRQADERLHYVHKLWRYYADKFDQRAGPDNDPVTRTLRAADEVIWSCWKTAVKNLGAPLEFLMPAPLAYLSPQFAASTTHRDSYPPDLRPSLHSVFADHVKQLSIPMIALPPVCQRRPWWLVIAAHEVGHHVQWALPEAAERAETTITAAAGGRLAARWLGWREELLADACAVLLVGPAVIWAITELETRPAPALGTGRYPPPLVRLAMAHALAAKAGLSDSAFQERQVPALASSLPSGNRDGNGDIAELLGAVPAVADALLGATSNSGAELLELARVTGRAYDQDVIGYWARALLRHDPPAPEKSLGAARFCVAGSVAAWQSVASRDGTAQELADRTASLAAQVRKVLPDCAEPGTRGGLAGTEVQDRAAELARRFAADLYAIDLAADAAVTDDKLTEGADQP